MTLQEVLPGLRQFIKQVSDKTKAAQRPALPDEVAGFAVELLSVQVEGTGTGVFGLPLQDLGQARHGIGGLPAITFGRRRGDGGLVQLDRLIKPAYVPQVRSEKIGVREHPSMLVTAHSVSGAGHHGRQFSLQPYPRLVLIGELR